MTWRAKLQSEKYAKSPRGRRRRAGHRRPFAHDFLFSLRQAAPVLVAALALFAVLVPVSTSVVNDISVFNVNYTHEQLKFQFNSRPWSTRHACCSAPCWPWYCFGFC